MPRLTLNGQIWLFRGNIHRRDFLEKKKTNTNLINIRRIQWEGWKFTFKSCYMDFHHFSKSLNYRNESQYENSWCDLLRHKSQFQRILSQMPQRSFTKLQLKAWNHHVEYLLYLYNKHVIPRWKEGNDYDWFEVKRIHLIN